MPSQRATAAELGRLIMFRDIDSNHLTRLAQAGRLVVFSPGQKLYRRGEPAVGSALLLLEGRLSVRLPGVDRPIHKLRAGDIAGETALFSKAGVRSADVLADTAGRALEITPELMSKTALNPATARLEQYLLSSLARRIRQTTARLQQARHEAGLAESSADAPKAAGSIFNRLRALFGN
jgi:CRP-like cAMP-binding protein